MEGILVKQLDTVLGICPATGPTVLYDIPTRGLFVCTDERYPVGATLDGFALHKSKTGLADGTCVIYTRLYCGGGIATVVTIASNTVTKKSKPVYVYPYASFVRVCAIEEEKCLVAEARGIMSVFDGEHGDEDVYAYTASGIILPGCNRCFCSHGYLATAGIPWHIQSSCVVNENMLPDPVSYSHTAYYQFVSADMDTGISYPERGETGFEPKSIKLVRSGTLGLYWAKRVVFYRVGQDLKSLFRAHVVRNGETVTDQSVDAYYSICSSSGWSTPINSPSSIPRILQLGNNTAHKVRTRYYSLIDSVDSRSQYSVVGADGTSVCYAIVLRCRKGTSVVMHHNEFGTDMIWVRARSRNEEYLWVDVAYDGKSRLPVFALDPMSRMLVSIPNWSHRVFQSGAEVCIRRTSPEFRQRVRDALSDFPW